MSMRYDEIQSVDQLHAELAFATGNTEGIVYALLGTTLNGVDWEWVEKWCLHFLDSPVHDIRNTAIICLGHLARIHRRLHKGEVLNALLKYVSDPNFAGRVEDAIEDIEAFVK